MPLERAEVIVITVPRRAQELCFWSDQIVHTRDGDKLAKDTGIGDSLAACCWRTYEVEEGSDDEAHMVMPHARRT